MIGSSIFEFWQQPNWGSLNISNNAIRRTQSQDWCNSDLSMLPKAKNYLVYCGSNDLIYGVPPAITVANINSVLFSLTKLHPNAKIGYFSIMKCPQKRAEQQLTVIDKINDHIKTVTCCGINNQIYYFDFNDYINNDNKWFADDGLHLTDRAYQMLDEKLTPVLSRWALAS
jgi:hypothetical protein